MTTAKLLFLNGASYAFNLHAQKCAGFSEAASLFAEFGAGITPNVETFNTMPLGVCLSPHLCVAWKKLMSEHSHEDFSSDFSSCGWMWMNVDEAFLHSCSRFGCFCCCRMLLGLCYVMLYYIMLCYIILCYVICFHILCYVHTHTYMYAYILGSIIGSYELITCVCLKGGARWLASKA